MSKSKDKNKQVINETYIDTLEKINRIKTRVESNIIAKRASKEQEQIDDILVKIKKDL